MTEPHPLLQPLLHGIESVSMAVWDEHPNLVDKDVEWVYTAYHDYFKTIRTGKDVPEPISTSRRREALLAGIWEMLLLREELGADNGLVDSDFAPGGSPLPNLESVYVMAFARLVKSVRFWRKTAGNRGYLRFVQDYV